MSDLSQFDLYSSKVKERLQNPKHQGKLTEDDAKNLGGNLIVGEHINDSCGDGEILYWIVDEDSKILDAKFESFGCGTSLASTDMMVEMTIGKQVDDAIKITNVEVELNLRDEPNTPSVPSEKVHCSVSAYDVLLKTAAKYKNVDVDSLKNKEIVCECAQVTRGEILEAIRENNIKTVEEIQEITKAGTFCGKCVKPKGEDRVYYIKDILNEELAKQKNEEIHKKLTTDNFDDMTFLNKMRTIDEVIKKSINPKLAFDGGAIELVDIKEKDGIIEVYINYLGACSSCSSSGTTTLYAIDVALKEELNTEKIQVIANNPFTGDF
jgi:NifU-like protein